MAFEKLESWLQKKNQNIEDMRTEIWMQSQGHNTIHTEKSWWSRNYIKLIWYGLLITSLPTCYYLGFTFAARLLFMLLAFQFGFMLWRLIKKGYNILKTYLAAKKLLKQMFPLKKD